VGKSFFVQAEDGIRDRNVTGVQTCALPICDLAEALLTTGLFARGGQVTRPGPTREITLTTHDLRVLPTVAERTRLSFHVEMDVEPHPDQSADSAADELAELFTQYLTDKRMPFFEDYGITPEDLAEARAHGEVAGFAGYDGPFAI